MALPFTSRPTTHQRLRPGLRWSLGLTAAATVWALLSPVDGNLTPAAEVDATTKRASPQAKTSTTAPTTASRLKPTESPALVLPARLPELAMEAADRDPFMIPPPPPPPTPLTPPAPPPPPAPTAPPLTYRYLGSMVDPEGTRRVYLARADKDLLVQVGTQLDEGYKVEAITDGEIRLIYEPLQVRAVIRIPSAQPTP